MGHIIWDWNGTLLNDLPLLAESTSAALAGLGKPPIDVETYRLHHARPLSTFYTKVAGRELTEGEMTAINHEFHAAYASVLHRATLASDAITALQTVNDSGRTQSLLSMWTHDPLLELVEELGVSGYFVRIDGQAVASVASKTTSLEHHLARLENDLGNRLDLTSITMVGDTVDDGQAAQAMGVQCVLVSTGAQTAEALRSVGWPVVNSLTEAIGLVL